MASTIIIVERIGTLKTLSIKDFHVHELYKKCGFKKQEDFIKQTEWNVTHDGKQYLLQVFGKTDGRATSENKYEFPPPIDSTLFYGSCAIVAQLKTGDHFVQTELSLALWDKLVSILFGGFSDLGTEESEEDELAHIPKEKKTKSGYLKDNFVVDDSDTKTEDDEPEETEEEETEEATEEATEEGEEEGDTEEDGEEEENESELSIESYDYDDTRVA